MKLADHFDTFLCDTVNLNQARLDRLESSVEAIKSVIRNSAWEPRIRRFLPQGSWAHKTIIKPTEGAAFDADLLVFVDPRNGWEAKRYVNTLYDIFKNHGTYEDKVEVWDYCVTINYAGDFKIDIAPCVQDRERPGYEVCNRSTNQFEPSKPAEYTSWLADRNTWTGRNMFRKVTRLLKYLRDIKSNFTCPSVLFSSLLGLQINEGDQHNNADFSDLASSLRTIIGRLDDWLQRRPYKPQVLNPVMGTEDFGRLWSDNTKYSNFRDKIHLYRGWIDDAYQESDRDESIGKWRRVFGEEFARGVDVEAASLGKTAIVALKEDRFVARNTDADMVALISRYGDLAIPEQITRLPYMHRPKWQTASAGRFEVVVKMSLHNSMYGSFIGSVDKLTTLPKGCSVKFSVYDKWGLPLSNEYRVYWRITNTDKEATAAGQLRGEFNVFNDSNDGTSRWESLKYRGLHLAEAFVVRKRDERLVAESLPCYVVIE